MAATDRAARRRARRKSRSFIRELPWIAAGLGALAARDAYGQSSIDTRFLFYKESGGRTQVLNPVVLLHDDLGETWGGLNLMLAYDSISGASPTGGYPSLDVTTSASGHTTSAGNFPQTPYTDARKSVGLSWSRKFGAHLPSIDVSYAKENDYVARSFGFSDAWTMAQGRGTLHFGAAFARDLVEPVKNSVSNPEGLSLSYPKSENGYSLGWTWIFGERDLADLSASLMNLSGDLDDPYKIVPIGPPESSTTSPDHRPDTRSRRAIVGKYGHSYLWGGVLKVNYRYYWDDWSIRAHTLDVTYDQTVTSDWIVSPRVRLYTQNGASFYGSSFASPQTYMSADYRLSPLDSWLVGLGLTHRIDETLSVNLGAAYQSQRGRDRVTPIAATPSPTGAGAITASAADLTVVTITAGFTWSY